MRITTLAIALALTASPALAGSTSHSGSSHGTHNAESTEHSEGKMVHTTATLNAVADDSLNVSHPPIPALKWPAMTMDLPLLEGAKVGEIAAGDKVMLMLMPNGEGSYGISSVMPAE